MSDYRLASLWDIESNEINYLAKQILRQRRGLDVDSDWPNRLDVLTLKYSTSVCDVYELLNQRIDALAKEYGWR